MPADSAVTRREGEPRLLVVGTGLIGTSVALAARAAGYEVWLTDRDADRLALAVSLGAGQARHGTPERVDLAVIAVPPGAVATIACELIASGVAETVMHCASVQTVPQVEVETMIGHQPGFVGSHPVAGRERSGPHHASGELFQARPWIVCPTAHSAPRAVESVSALAQACGAVVSVMPAAVHDELLARLSHVPQLVGSALAAALVGLDRQEVALAGTGLRDTSRLADSDPDLWADIVAANPTAVARALHLVLDPLEDLVAALESGDARSAAAVHRLVQAGRAGRALLAGKHGQQPVRWASVSVVVPDEAGALARLLVDAAASQVNVEDIRVDHSPGQPFGVVELDVAPDRSESLALALHAHGWTANANPPPH